MELTNEQYKEMGRKAFLPNELPGKICPWAIWPHTYERVEYWTAGWCEAKEKWEETRVEYEMEIPEKIYLLFIWESTGYKEPTFEMRTTDKEIALNHYKKTKGDPFCTGYVDLLTASSIKRVLHEEDL